MTLRQTPARLSATALVVPLVLALGGCEMSFGHLAGRASDEWTRTYQLSPGGEIVIGNTNGRVEIEGTDGSTVDVRAERIARAATDAAARELLPRIQIVENAKPDRVSVETARMAGMLFGVSYEVRYHVKAPKAAAVTAHTTNGEVILSSLTGKVDAETTNGAVKGTGLLGAVRAQTTNGAVSIDLASLGTQPIELGTTNGGVRLAIPESAKATLSASVTNGGIRVTGLNLDVQEQSRRRLEAKMNGGGTTITVHTTNGGIRIESRSDAQAAGR